MGTATPQECRKEGAESVGMMERSKEMETEKKERRGKRKEERKSGRQKGRQEERKKTFHSSHALLNSSL